MEKKECIAMILAGGKGERLGAVTTMIAKPALPFGGKHRLIDFTLSNCVNSGIDTVGVLMPPHSFDLSNKVEWTGKDGRNGKTAVYALPPSGAQPYKGTADAIYANILFIDRFRPKAVLVLSGDHIYKMDYSALLSYHVEKRAAATIAVIGVPWADASRFGIMTTRPDGSISEFTEKPSQPKSNLASMGVYVFTWDKLKEYLVRDTSDTASNHDFGKNVIPAMLASGESMYAYPFGGYWKDVGTVESLYDAHMDLLGDPPGFSLFDNAWPIYATCPAHGKEMEIKADIERNSLVHAYSHIQGIIEGTIVFSNVHIGENATVKNSVIMPGAMIGKEAYVERAIIGPEAVIEDGCVLRGGSEGIPPIAVLGEYAVLSAAHKAYSLGRR